MKTFYRKSTILYFAFAEMWWIQIRWYEGSLIFVFVYFLFSTLPAQSRKDSRLREELKISDHMNIELIILVWYEKEKIVICNVQNFRYIRIMLSIFFVAIQQIIALIAWKTLLPMAFIRNYTDWLNCYQNIQNMLLKRRLI